MYLCYLKSLSGLTAEKCSQEWLEGNEKLRPCEYKVLIPPRLEHLTIEDLRPILPPPDWVGAEDNGNGN